MDKYYHYSIEEEGTEIAIVAEDATLLHQLFLPFFDGFLIGTILVGNSSFLGSRDGSVFGYFFLNEFVIFIYEFALVSRVYFPVL